MKIPTERAEGDVEYIKNEFRTLFDIDEMVNTVVVQKFDEEWDAYIDMDENEVLINKDKVKVVLMPIMDSMKNDDAKSNVDKPEVRDFS